MKFRKKRYSRYEKNRYNQEKELNSYYAKPVSERVAIKIEKGARKYDEFLENLRNKAGKTKETVSQNFARSKAAIGTSFRNTQQTISPVAQYFRRTRAHLQTQVLPVRRPRFQLPRLY